MDSLEKITALIEAEIPNSRVLADTLDDVHFSVIVIAPCFAEMGRLQQHRKVMNALKKELESAEIHAVGLKTYTPAAYAALKKPAAKP